MHTPVPPSPRQVPGVIMRLIARSHGIELKSIASAITFIVIGFFAITLKNVLFAGLSLEESLLATIPTLLVKGSLGYVYPAVRDPVLTWAGSGWKRVLAESVMYAFLQTASFLLVVSLLIPVHRLPQAALGTFVTSLFVGKLVGMVIDKLTEILGRVRSWYRARTV